MKYSFGFIVAGIIIFNFFASIVLYAQVENEYDFEMEFQITEEIDSPVYVLKIDTLEYPDQNFHIYFNINVFEKRNNLIQTIRDSSDYHYAKDHFHFEDINMDGYKDIRIHLGHHNLSPRYSFWLFDETKKYFYPGINFNNLMEYNINKKTKLIKSHYTAVGGMGYANYFYTVSNDSLILIESYNHGHHSYKNEKYLDGKLSYHEKIKEEYNEEYPKGFFLLEEKKIICDTLLVSKKEWITKKTIRPNLTKRKNKVVCCDKLLKCYKYIKREEYNYTLIDKELIADTTYYIVENDKWVKQK